MSSAQCAVHASMEALGTCVRCGVFVCEKCLVDDAGLVCALCRMKGAGNQSVRPRSALRWGCFWAIGLAFFGGFFVCVRADEEGVSVGCSTVPRDGGNPCPPGQQLSEEKLAAPMLKGRGCRERTAKARRQGEWEFLYEDGQRMVGSLVDGEKEGLFTVWHPNGKKQEESQWKAGRKEGPSTVWYETGQLKSKSSYSAHILDGPSSLWHPNGKLQAQGTFSAGKWEGLLTSWYDNGQKEQESTFVDGKEEGVSTKWFPNGRKKIEATYKGGKKEGRFAAWHENGQRNVEATFKQDRLDGVETLWDATGRKTSEKTFIEGKSVAK